MRLKSTLFTLLAILVLWMPMTVKGHTADWPAQKISLLDAIEHISKEYEVYFTFDMTLVADVKVEYNQDSYKTAKGAISGILEGTALKFQFYDLRFVIIYQEDAEGLKSLKEMSRHLDGLITEGEKTINEAPNREIRTVPIIEARTMRKFLKPLAFNIEGTIVDQEGEALIGVNIQVKGTNKGTSTDFEGRFTLSDIDENAILVVSYVGYQTQEMAVAGKSSVSVTLLSDSQLLEEVVVVGYGTQKKENLTGAVSNVTSEVLENRPITNIGQGLQGQVSNLNISQNNGALGGGTTFNIRGFTSINGGSPLILVDNVPMDVNMINPNDVASISVLKDAASAAIYGARAAYGVILITTKKGSKNNKPKVTLSTNQSINTPVVKFEAMDALERMNYMNTANIARNGTPYSQFNEITGPAIIEHYNDPSKPSAIPDPQNPSRYLMTGNTNWSDVLLRDYYPQQQYTASVSGGSDKFDYYTSLNYLYQEGISNQFDEKYNRYNFMTNLNYDLTSWLNVGTRISLNNSDKYYPPNNSANHVDEDYSGFQWHQWSNWPVYFPNGKYASSGSVPNMVQLNKEGGHRKRDVRDAWLTGTAKLTPIKNVSINLDYSTNVTNTTEENYWKRLEMYYVDGSVAGYFPYTNPSQVTKSYYEENYHIFNAYADYTNSFGAHDIKFMAGFNQEDFTYSYFNAKRENLTIETIPFMNLASGERYVGDGATEYAIRGAFTRFNYNYDDRYLFEFNGRYDGSSKFPKNDRFAFFPSASLGWRVDNEAFFEGMKQTFDMFKFRLSYGSLGNQNVPGNYPYISTFNTGTVDYLLNNEGPLTLYAPGLVSPTLTWETVTQQDLGLDLAMFDYRLTASFDIYQRFTKNMLTRSETLPAVLAVSEPRTNAADLKTTGWDMNIGWRQQSKEVSWGVKLILSDYTTKITRFSNPSGLLNDYYVGQDIGEIWGFVTKGIAQTDEEATALDMTNVIGLQRAAGDLVFEDLNGDGKITYGKGTLDDHGDRKIIGNNTPRLSFGFKTDVTWKGFDLDVFFQGVAKRDKWLSTSFWIGGFNDEWRAHNKVLTDWWSPDNRDSYFPRPVITGGRDVTTVQTRFLQDAAYLRLKQLTLGYTIPTQWTSRLKMDKVRLFLSGNNVWEVTGIYKYKNVSDPEMDGAFYYPINRSFAFGANINF